MDVSQRINGPLQFIVFLAGGLIYKLVKGAVMKTYKDFPHGMPTTNADQINADLLEFIKS